MEVLTPEEKLQKKIERQREYSRKYTKDHPDKNRAKQIRHYYKKKEEMRKMKEFIELMKLQIPNI